MLVYKFCKASNGEKVKKVGPFSETEHKTEFLSSHGNKIVILKNTPASPSFWFWFWFSNQQDSLTNMFVDVLALSNFCNLDLILDLNISKVLAFAMSLARPFHALIQLGKNDCPYHHMGQRCNRCGSCGGTFEKDFSWYVHQPFPDMNVVPQPSC